MCQSAELIVIPTYRMALPSDLFEIGNEVSSRDGIPVELGFPENVTRMRAINIREMIASSWEGKGATSHSVQVMVMSKSQLASDSVEVLLPILQSENLQQCRIRDPLKRPDMSA